MDQFVLDQLPDDAGHLVAVELDDGSGHLDLLHLGLKKGARLGFTRTISAVLRRNKRAKAPQLDLTVNVGTDAEGRRVPLVLGSGTAVSEVVRVCHDRTIDVGLAELAIDGLDRGYARAGARLLRRGALRHRRGDLPRLRQARRGRRHHQLRPVRRALSRDRHRRWRGAHRGQGRGGSARRQPRDAGRDVGRGTLLVLGAPRAAQAAARHPPVRSARLRLCRRRRDARRYC